MFRKKDQQAAAINPKSKIREKFTTTLSFWDDNGTSTIQEVMEAERI